MKISIIGSGFVGTAIGEGLIELNNELSEPLEKRLERIEKEISR